MVSILSLCLPILLSAVAVFILSSLIHILLPYHRSDFGKLPDEDKVMDAPLFLFSNHSLVHTLK